MKKKKEKEPSASPKPGSVPTGPARAERPLGIVADSEPTLLAKAEVGLDVTFPGLVSPCTLTSVTFHGGAIGTADPVHLLFWGSTWSTLPDPSNPGQLLFNTFTAAVQSILAGPWISALRQYGIKRCSFGSARIVNSNPPFLPTQFAESDVQGVVQSLIDDNTFPEPDEAGGRNLYVVVMPPNTQSQPVSGLTARGAHSSFNSGSIIDVDTAWYAWVGSQKLSGMTSTFCHELAEMCTNPEGDGWYIDGAGPACFEIGDICNNLNSTLNGVTVESYWSVYDGACIVPTAWSVRRTLAAAGKKLGGKGLRSLQDPILSLNQLIVNL
jgi:hypothetical protein